MRNSWLLLVCLGLFVAQAAGICWAADSAPSVFITAPENGSTATIGETLDVYIATSGDAKVSTVALTCDGRGIGMTSEAPATLKWDTSALTAGAHTLRARAVLDSGEAISSDPVVVTLFGPAETTAMSETSAPGSAEAPEAMSGTNLGVGLGIPYGIFGLNLESGGQTRFSGGVGWGVAELGWNVGVKHYFRPLSENRGSASISAYYGTNTIVQRGGWWSGDDELQQGFSVGLGWTKGHFDIGAIVPFISDIPSGYKEEGPRVKLYIGYRFGSTAQEPSKPRERGEAREATTPARKIERPAPSDYHPKTEW